MRPNGKRTRSFDQFQITERSEFDRKILESLIRLIDDEDVEEDVEFLYVDVGFRVDRIGESGELYHASEFRDEIFFRRFERSGRFREVQLVLSRPVRYNPIRLRKEN